jgi:hypothetical protein
MASRHRSTVVVRLPRSETKAHSSPASDSAQGRMLSRRVSRWTAIGSYADMTHSAQRVLTTCDRRITPAFTELMARRPIRFIRAGQKAYVGRYGHLWSVVAAVCCSASVRVPRKARAGDGPRDVPEMQPPAWRQCESPDTSYVLRSDDTGSRGDLGGSVQADRRRSPCAAVVPGLPRAA